MIINDYGITINQITSRNSQTNSILERVHQTMGNILRSFKVQNMVLDDKNPWDGILASTMLMLRAAVKPSTQYTPDQLIFGRDSMINRRHDIDWEAIRRWKQNHINEGNKRENRNLISHTYKQGDKVLLKNEW